jgi:hypothetical protein
MRLSIARGQEQQTDHDGRVVFHFSCRLELSPDELGLVEKYNQLHHSITPLGLDDIYDYDARELGGSLTVSRLTEGWSVQSKYGADLQRVEAAIRAGCKDFHDLFVALRTYGGEEVVEF